MEATFGTILIVIALVAIVVACVSYIGSGGIYRGLGRTGMTTLDEPDMRPGPAPGTAAANAEAQEEIRQMLEAKSDRREARGESPLDIDAEMAELQGASTPQDEALREEVRQLVVARNERRMRRAEEPLDVESEVDRQLRDLTS
ncbi:MAG: hypothetical protein AABM31_01025 [Actinomycetota bacterium]